MSGEQAPRVVACPEDETADNESGKQLQTKYKQKRPLMWAFLISSVLLVFWLRE